MKRNLLSQSVDCWCSNCPFVVADIWLYKIINSLEKQIVAFRPQVNQIYNSVEFGHSLI